MKDHEIDLSNVLRQWRVGSTLPPHFAEQVWKRIKREEVPRISLAEALRAWFAVLFARPAFALAYVTVLLIAGLTFGFVQANHKTADWDRHLQSLYVQSVDPYQRGH